MAIASTMSSTGRRQRELHAFAAGALVAIGTGAMLMIIPEVIHERARGRERKRGRR